MLFTAVIAGQVGVSTIGDLEVADVAIADDRGTGTDEQLRRNVLYDVIRRQGVGDGEVARAIAVITEIKVDLHLSMPVILTLPPF